MPERIIDIALIREASCDPILANMGYGAAYTLLSEIIQRMGPALGESTGPFPELVVRIPAASLDERRAEAAREPRLPDGDPDGPESPIQFVPGLQAPGRSHNPHALGRPGAIGPDGLSNPSAELLADGSDVRDREAAQEVAERERAVRHADDQGGGEV